MLNEQVFSTMLCHVILANVQMLIAIFFVKKTRKVNWLFYLFVFLS